MFLTITPMERPHPRSSILRIWNRMADKINPPVTQIENHELCGVRFSDVRIYVPGKTFPQNWRGPHRIHTRYALCPKEFDLPAGCLPAVTADAVRQLRARVWCSTAVNVLRQCAVPISEKRIGLIDPDCRFPALPELLINSASEIVVWTKNRALYQGYADRILEEYGAPVQFVTDWESLHQTILILHTGPQMLHGFSSIPILSVWENTSSDNSLLFDRPFYFLPEAEAVLPPGINREEFYTALWERCHLHKIGQLSIFHARCGEKNVSTAEIVRKIRENHEISH